MLGRNFFIFGKIVLAVSVLLLAADSVMAYVGPGVDVTLIGQFFTLIGFAVAACSAVLMYPIYAILRRIRGHRGNPTQIVNQINIVNQVNQPTSPVEATPEETRVTSKPTDL